jgi:hypothetical protein
MIALMKPQLFAAIIVLIITTSKAGMMLLRSWTVHHVSAYYRPLFQTRQAQASLLKWIGNTDDYYTYIKKYWEKNIYPKQTMHDFQTFGTFT